MTCEPDSGSVCVNNCQPPKNNSRRIANTDYFISYNVNGYYFIIKNTRQHAKCLLSFIHHLTHAILSVLMLITILSVIIFTVIISSLKTRRHAKC